MILSDMIWCLGRPLFPVRIIIPAPELCVLASSFDSYIALSHSILKDGNVLRVSYSPPCLNWFTSFCPLQNAAIEVPTNPPIWGDSSSY